ncbi:MAG: DUF721 domain-containing protein [Armatimonadota bacterium]|nr:DUF721 domain-containing protein [Armatimonadota bacterium]
MRTASEALRRLLTELGVDRQLRTYEALAHWSEIVGKPVAQAARPLRFDAGTLWVAVKSHTWAQELTFQKQTILRRLNERAKEERFQDIRFVVRQELPPLRGVGEVLIADSAPSLAAIPLTEAEEAEIEARVASIAEPKLREVLRQAQRATLRYQKYLAQQGWRRCVVCGCYHSDDSAICFLCAQGV